MHYITEAHLSCYLSRALWKFDFWIEATFTKLMLSDIFEIARGQFNSANVQALLMLCAQHWHSPGLMLSVFTVASQCNLTKVYLHIHMCWNTLLETNSIVDLKPVLNKFSGKLIQFYTHEKREMVATLQFFHKKQLAYYVPLHMLTLYWYNFSEFLYAYILEEKDTLALAWGDNTEL